MGDMQAIGYGGQPVRDVFHAVRPPAPVFIDLIALFPHEPHTSGRYNPFGLQMQKVVEGELSCWALCEQGQWWGLVTYPIRYGANEKTVTHWIPAWILKPKTDGGKP
ncbi:hypothetical protein R4419_33755 [Mycolicibacterium fortuitum]|uniref:Uncharacterized protein n=3 Tax=Mycolicibacterium fortuitum TaxID=1766 RepID=A0AAE4VJJ4_MYCFO|nr:hypothetical protein [Mycolicibacterium fortuitum]MCV7142877.1 hypothetical protein [Mycolicibacterium fortuitum]MDV7195120.1 hypothetical protein [Mycolicibacterium fortuitum]MDV7208821.1 hypothetical protein [Mycolicibacterium fortuitum]MDV7230725.1 hypothetical protein [Mycolicibacterium fortuitum]MDV7262244.1 hypothetical protein [Mycolicibacterium fortuitum]